jgi:hypothetical protein
MPQIDAFASSPVTTSALLEARRRRGEMVLQRVRILDLRPHDKHPEWIGVRMGTFDGDPGVRPSVRSWVGSAATWEPIQRTVSAPPRQSLWLRRRRLRPKSNLRRGGHVVTLTSG